MPTAVTEYAPASRVTAVPLALPEKFEGIAFVPLTEIDQSAAVAMPGVTPLSFVTRTVTVK